MGASAVSARNCRARPRALSTESSVLDAPRRSRESMLQCERKYPWRLASTKRACPRIRHPRRSRSEGAGEAAQKDGASVAPRRGVWPGKKERRPDSRTLYPCRAQVYHELRSLVGIRILDDDEDVFAIRCNHDLVLAGADAQEGEVVLRVQVTHDAPGLRGELRDERGILQRVLRVQRRTDRHALAVHDDDSRDALVRLDAPC